MTIQVKQEISNIAGENIQLTEGVSSPIFQTREVETNVTVRDGETVVIGGLIQSRHSVGENKVPILGDLPLIGFLFRSTAISKNRTELLVAMTVDVIRNDEDMRRISKDRRSDYKELNITSKLFDGLRIIADEGGLGPVDTEAISPAPGGPAPAAEPDESKRYGPMPKVYGPKITRPTITTTAVGPVYGPRIARSGWPEDG